MTDGKKTYQYEAKCTRLYDGLECDGPCKTCDDAARDHAEDANFTRQ